MPTSLSLVSACSSQCLWQFGANHMNISYSDVPGPGQLELPLTYLLASCLPNLIPSSLYCQTQLPKSPFLSGYFQSSMASLCRQNKIQARWTDIEGFLPILLHLPFQARSSALTGTIPVPAEPDHSASSPDSSSCSCRSSAWKICSLLFTVI